MIRKEYLNWAKSLTSNSYLPFSSVSNENAEEFVNSIFCSELFNELIFKGNQWGLDFLKDQIKSRYNVRNERDIVLTPGASTGIFLVMFSLLKNGDEVLIEYPSYEPFTAIALSLGVKVTYWKRKADFSLDFDSLESKITSKTKLVIITNLHNPSGYFVNKIEMNKLAEVTQKNKINVIVDEVYFDLTRKKANFLSASEISPNMISLNSLSKVYGLSKLRSGWIIAEKKICKKLKLDYLKTLNIGSIYLEAATAIFFNHISVYLNESIKKVQANKNVLKSILIDNSSILSGKLPEYGCTYFPQFHDKELIELINKKGYAVPGSYFGDDYKNYVRFGLGCNTEKFKESFRLIGLLR